VDFSGQRVGVIGTGSSGIQVIPEVAAQADRVYVFQRTPNFSIPARDRPLDPETERAVKASYSERRAAAQRSPAALPVAPPAIGISDVDDEGRNVILEGAWEVGGNAMQLTFTNLLVDEATNNVVSGFIRSKIRTVVKDREVAELLCPTDYPFGAKRVCKDTNYYETFNRSNVTLVDLRAEPLVGLSPSGLRTAGAHYQLDSIIFATGFDAFTGALLRMDILGRDGLRLAEVWSEGPKTYLGLMVSGFPNLFVVTGPGSPSVLTNMVAAIEQHVEWISECLRHLRAEGQKAIEATSEAELDWVLTTNEVAARTLYMRASSWYLGANIAGKPRVFMPYVGGFNRYREICDEIATAGYKGFQFS
jgi:cyclohexanone monooxygenase